MLSFRHQRFLHPLSPDLHRQFPHRLGDIIPATLYVPEIKAQSRSINSGAWRSSMGDVPLLIAPPSTKDQITLFNVCHPSCDLPHVVLPLFFYYYYNSHLLFLPPLFVCLWQWKEERQWINVLHVVSGNGSET